MGSSLLWSKKNWKYLGFIFDRKLSFYQYICFYSNKTLSTIKDMEMLDNSIRGLLPFHKCLLYHMCIIPITLYRFPLWYFKSALLYHSLKKLKKIQQRAAPWIMGTFHTLSSLRVEAITGLILIYLYLEKISGR